MRYLQKRKTRAMRLCIPLVLFALFAAPIFAHDDHVEKPQELPPIGPHGGEYTQMDRHFAEVVVRGGEARIYILEPDVRQIAADASEVRVEVQIPGQPRRSLSLVKRGDAYVARIEIPPTARRVQFFVACAIEGRRESGVIQYEPRG